MIVSASYKTDIPAFYGAWFMNRLRAGYCMVSNPYNRRLSFRVSLRREDVDGFVFWTKNLGPFLPVLEEIHARGVPFVIQYTINAYPRTLESSVTDAARSVVHARAIASRYGPRALVWRYDPIVFSSETTAAVHLKAFARLARALEGATDEVVVSFAQIYRKTRRNMDEVARQSGLAWNDPSADRKRSLLRELVPIARAHRMQVTLCSQPELLSVGVNESRCIDARRLSALAGSAVAARLRGPRKQCGCYESKDIGAYDTCPHGCVYCYAVTNRRRAQGNFAAHDPQGEFLFPPRTPAAALERQELVPAARSR